LDPTTWFQAYLAGPLLVFLYLVWKAYSWFVRPADRPLWIKTSNIDILTGMRDLHNDLPGEMDDYPGEKKKGALGQIKGVFSSVF
jgi:amino acid transporter